VCGASSQTSDAELRALLAAGVGEVYVGYLPPRWRARYGAELSPNRRYRVCEQVLELHELRRIGATVRDAGAAFVLALNEHYHPRGAWDLVDEVVDAGLDCGATGLIVADPVLLQRLGRRGLDDLELIVSQEAGLENAGAVSYFAARGAARVILPRQTRLDEAAALCAAAARRGVQVEAFAAREYCHNASARCFVSHGYGRAGYFCGLARSKELVELPDGRRLSVPPAPRLLSDSPAYLAALAALHRCGLCALQPLLSMGVRYLKLPGRSSSALAAVRLVGRLLDGGDLSPAACRALLDSPEFCAGQRHCYYQPGAPELESAPGQSRRSPRVSASPRRPPAPAPAPQNEASPELTLRVPAGVGPLGLPASLRAHGLAALPGPGSPMTAWERHALTAMVALLERRSTASVTRVEIGAESCALRWPSVDSLHAQVTSWRSAGFEVSLALPVAYQASMMRLAEMVDALLERGAAVDEIAVNDLGLLSQAAGRWPVRLVAGRLLWRAKRDVFAADPAVLPAAKGAAASVLAPPGRPGPIGADKLIALRATQQASAGVPYLDEPEWQAELRLLGVSATSLDVLPTPLSRPLGGPLRHHVHLPWTLLSTTRICPVAAALEGGPLAHPTVRCARPCREHAIVHTYPWRHPPIVQRGVALHMDCSAAAEPFLESLGGQPVRLVLHPWVPW